MVLGRTAPWWGDRLVAELVGWALLLPQFPGWYSLGPTVNYQEPLFSSAKQANHSTYLKGMMIKYAKLFTQHLINADLRWPRSL